MRYNIKVAARYGDHHFEVWLSLVERLDQLRICFDRSFFVVMHSLSVLYWNRKNRAERG